MKLYYTPGTCALASHIALREAGLDCGLEKVDLATKRTASGNNYLTVNPNGYVPALEIQPGLILTEGPAILQYIADQAPAAKLAPPNGSIERYQLQSWLNFITAEIHKSFSPLFNPNSAPQTKEAFKEVIGKRFDRVEQHLAKQEYLLAGGFSVADAYLFVTSGWCGYVDIDLNKWPALVAFRQRIEARPSVQQALREEGLAK